MARQQAALVAFGLAVVALLSFGDEPRPPADPLARAPASPNPERDSNREGGDKDKDKDADRHKRRSVFAGPDAEKAREAFRNMSPEERERWTKRIREWTEMPPEKKKALADREEFFRRKINEDIDAAIVKSGLTLSEEQKKQFGERYLDERRKIESELRKEMEEKRGPRVDAMIDKLKQEFAARVEVKAENPDKR
jgi:hypothetical protein